MPKKSKGVPVIHAEPNENLQATEKPQGYDDSIPVSFSAREGEGTIEFFPPLSDVVDIVEGREVTRGERLQELFGDSMTSGGVGPTSIDRYVAPTLRFPTPDERR